MASRDRRDFQGMYRPRTSADSTDPSSSGAWLDPFSQFRRLSDQMDRLFDTMGVTRNAPSREHPGSGAADLWAPELETCLRDDQFIVRMDLPGVKKEEVNVEVTDDALVIHGERQQTHQEERDGFYRSERTYGRFYREVPLPEGAQPDSAKANYRDGVLEISVTAPPRQLARPRRVEIGGASIPERPGREQRTGSATERISVAHDVKRGEPMD